MSSKKSKAPAKKTKAPARKAAAPKPAPADDCGGGAAPDQTPGLLAWNELYTHDRAGSVAFYSAMFGWKANEMDMGGFTYTIMELPGGRGAAGIFQPPGPAGPPTMWMGYVTVKNLKAAVAKAQKLGAKVCKEITKIPMGSFAIIADPQGGTIGLWEFAK